jgi:hypothetical protein
MNAEATTAEAVEKEEVHMHVHGFMERHGFRVERFNDPTAGKFTRETVAYLVTGARGTSYSLWRNKVNPRHLFVMNERGGRCRAGKIRGWEWFYDAPCGLIVPMR